MIWIRKALGLQNQASGKNTDPISIVVLLRKPLSLSDTELLQLADKAWGMDGPHGQESPSLVGATGSGQARILKVGTFLVAVKNADQRYEINRTLLRQSRNDVLDKAWCDQTAWIAVDHHAKGKVGRRFPYYEFLLRFATKLWDDDCTGLYLALEGVIIPRVGELLESFKWWMKQEGRSPFPDGPDPKRG